MSPTLTIQELAIAVAAPDSNPILLTPTFLESLSGNTDPLQPKIPDLAQKYINALPQLDYRAAAINPRSFLTFPDAGDDAARNYINALFAPALWQNAGSEPLKANLNLTYTLDGRKFNLTISEVKLQRDEEVSQMAVLFSGNFPNPLEGESNAEKLAQLQQAIAQ